MLKLLTENASRAFDIVAPRVCLVCDRALRQGFVCSACLPAQTLSSHGRCARCFVEAAEGVTCLGCELHPPPFDSMTLLWNYEAQVPPFIRAMKYRPSPRLCQLAAELAAGRMRGIVTDRNIEVVVPMPRSFHGLLQKTRNHLITISSYALDGSRAVLKQALSLNRIRLPQADLPLSSRAANANRSLRATNAVRGKVVLLIEDVVTTGATVADACRALREAGAREVHVFALARASSWETYRDKIG